jgi:hypothetical protein
LLVLRIGLPLQQGARHFGCVAPLGIQPMIEEKGSSGSGPAPQNAPLSARKKPLRAQRRVRILLRRVAIWLDNWGLRGYPHDTHDWASKSERLRNLKNTTSRLR